LENTQKGCVLGNAMPTQGGSCHVLSGMGGQARKGRTRWFLLLVERGEIRLRGRDKTSGTRIHLFGIVGRGKWDWVTKGKFTSEVGGRKRGGKGEVEFTKKAFSRARGERGKGDKRKKRERSFRHQFFLDYNRGKGGDIVWSPG